MTDDKVLKDAQYRKGLSIAYFNATNAAVEMVKLEGIQLPTVKKTKKPKKKVTLESRVNKWRDHFLKEHKEYYATVIANVGANYKSEDSIARLNGATNYEELVSVWISLSADEKKDGDIIKVAQELKAKYKTV